MDDNRRNYNEQEGEYFGKRFQGGERSGERINPNRAPYDSNFNGRQFSNQPPQNINGQMPVNNFYPPQGMPGQNRNPQMPQQMQNMPIRQNAPQMQNSQMGQMPQQMQNSQMGQMPQQMQNPQMGQMPQQMQNPQMNQMPPQMQSIIPPQGMPPQFVNGYGFPNQMQGGNGGYGYPSGGAFAQSDGGKKRSGFFGKGKKTLEEEFNDDMRNVIITYPKTFSDVQSIIDSLRSRQAIIVDLTKINDSSAQRILDFLSGAIYALGGSQQRIADNMFLFTPDGVSIQGPSDLKKRYD